MSTPTRPRQFSRQLAAWILAAAFGFGVYRVYRWAEPSPASLAAVTSVGPVNNINLQLDGVAFENFANGAKNWSLWAGRIILERPPTGGAPNSLQSADIEDIRDGKLFAANQTEKKERKKRRRGEEERERPSFSPVSLSAPAADNRQPSPTLTQTSADANAGTPIATFTAQHGRYIMASTEGLPADMLLAYTVQWQFRLTGDVKIRTREGYQLNAPAITMLELFNRRTGKRERQMLCDKGAQVKAKGASIQANQARYDDSHQSVEFLGGVRGALQKDSVQGEHFFWSLPDNTIRCPDQVSGVWNGSQYTASNILIDANRQMYTGKRVVMQLNGSAVSKLATGSLGLMMATGTIADGQGRAGAPPSPNPTSKSKVAAPIDARAVFEGDDLTMVTATKTSTARLFTYINGKRTITGDNGKYVQGKEPGTGILDANGHLVMDDPQHHAIGQQAHIEEKPGLATLEGDVVLTLKPDPDAAAANEKENGIAGAKSQGAVVTCDHVDSYYRKKFTILKGHLAFKQHILRKGQEPLERTGTAEHAEYDAKKEELVLYPPSKGQDSDGSEFYSDKDKVIIVTKPGAESIKGAHGRLVAPVKEELDDETDATPPPKTATDPKNDPKKPDAGPKK